MSRGKMTIRKDVSQGMPCLIMALRITSSFRIHAVTATFSSLP